MPLIQRNLFPARKSSNKASGPFSIHGPENQSSEKSRKISTGSKKKLSKNDAKSASLNSLVAIGKVLNKQNSGDSGHDSNDGNSSDPSLSSSCGSVDKVGPPPTTANAGAQASGISRKKILSRSRDAIEPHPSTGNGTSSDDYQSSSSTGSATINKAPDDDVWFNVSTLIEDHIEEIVSKWDQIDDEIWAKVICMERNRRVAKAYARAPILTINGCDNGFDGHRIGLAGFSNPWRDKRVVELKKDIDQGVKLRMDGEGNLLIKKATKSDVYLVSDPSLTPYEDNYSTGNAEAKQFCKLDARKSSTLFDMRQFQVELAREMRSMNPNTRGLEQQCFKFISFGKLSDELLNTPVWVIVINLVALEMIVKVLPNKLFDDNFYSLPTTALHRSHYEGLSGSSPPALPPRDLHNKKPPLTLPEPDYDEESDGAHGIYKVPPALVPPHRATMTFDDMHLDMSGDSKHAYIDDDPYYCGMQAHVPRYQRQDSKEADPKSSQNQNSMRSNPPIVRRKFWSQTAQSVGLKFFNRKKKTSLPETSAPAQWYSSGYGSTGSGYYSAYSGASGSTSLYSQPPTRSSTLDYRGNSSSGYYSNFSLLQSQYCIPVRDSDHLMSMMQQPPVQNQSYSSQNSSLVNDNNEIYGVNTSLLRKSVFNRSISSPSLKNMFFSGKNKDVNNNPVRQ